MADSEESSASAAASESPAQAAPPVQAAGAGGGSPDGLEWFTRRRALTQARSQLRENTPHVRELLQNGRAAAELGDRVYDAYEALNSKRGYDLAADLYRQCSYWCLCALREEPEAAASFAELWQTAVAIEELELPGEPEARDRLEQIFVEGDFRRLAALPDADKQRVASDLRGLAHSALLVSDPAERAVNELTFQRVMRIGGFVLLLVALVVFSVVSAISQPVDLAAGKPWKTSSVWAECRPLERRCGDLTTAVFFHTKEEESPWIEFDLGASQSVSEVVVKNRADEAAERAVPLVVELSSDAKKWKQAARQDATFSVWTASFQARKARYVRLRVDRRSYLHLEAVQIRP